ncbi:nitroreductase family deazaflavin-dependent oxidoreductase [Streptomyces sp. A7024]|uniref:Nitroreductase family deazaflavin-dependent oxidoreductase n=1 Tax=Streptomyces coryli TaxID=1128680 RepID=A0A6G4TUD4_9ACTN|nr:nitroreductase family deazaflavin-dependent oxidoreductase [Streptomyces coryli]NGN62601.1 nitroreductase family deazaflavin-dependent oxidoreductase [Streptomyces coryli]
MPASRPRPAQLDSALLPKIMKYMSRTQVWFYRRTRGRLGGKWRVGAGFRKPVPVLLLEHRGRKTGKVFTTPLLYVTDGDNIIVIASQGGRPRHPQWFHNLRAAPDTHLQIKANRRPVRAEVAEPEDRPRLWSLATAAYADFDNYQAWTEREIPVVILKPRP